MPDDRMMAKLMNEKIILDIFYHAKAILPGHFVYTSGRHGGVYVNKDAVYPYPHIHRLCLELVELMQDSAIADCLGHVEAIVAPAYGGIVLSRLVADYLMNLDFVSQEILAIYAEKSDDGKSFVFKRGYGELLRGKTVIAVDDILTTGGSVKKIVEAARACGAEVGDAAVLWNRGGKTADDLGLDCLVSLVDKKIDSWTEEDCPLCKQGMPVNTKVGKGKEFLAQRAQEKK